MAEATKLFDVSIRGARAFSKAPLPHTAPAEQVEVAPPRRLVRPRLPESLAIKAAPRRLRGHAPLVMTGERAPAMRNNKAAGSQAEASYFQKQMQAQTPLIFVLEDGEQIQGTIEWFDRDTIKVRNTTRVLLFKRSIKYLYKAGESRG